MSFGGIGSITKHNKDSIQYKIQSIKDLEILINHFEEYPLITQKWADYQLFKDAFNLVSKKQHPRPKVDEKIVNIRCSLNRGLSDELKTNFPNAIPVSRPLVKAPQEISPYWLSGFVSGMFYY